MINPTRRLLAGLWAGAGLLSLASCGGGAEPAAQSLPQAIALASPGEQRFGTVPAPLLATASSGLPVSLASSTPAVCTVSGTRLALLSVGTCTVSAQQPGDASFAPAAALTSSFEVAMGSQTITFVAPGNQALITPPAALVATASSGLAVGFASRTPAVCSVTGNSLALLGLGTCTLDATQAGNANFMAAPVASQSFTVASGLLAQAINFAAVGNQTLGSPAPALAATASSGLTVAFVATTADVCGVTGNTLTLTAPGTCTVAASQAGDARFAAAVAVLNSFTVLPAAQSISFTGPGNQTLGNPPPLLAASASSGLPVSLASGTPMVCNVNGTTLTLLAAGTCSVTASQAGDAGFAAAPAVSVAFAVAQASQTLSFAAPANQTLGTAPPALVASASSGLPVSLASSTPSVCSVSGSSLTLVAVGTCSLSASQAGNAVFAAATSVLRSFSVAAAPLIAQTLSFNSPGNQTLGSPPSALSASASSGLPVAFASSTPAVCTVSGSSLTLVALGNCSISASQAGNASFAAATPLVQTFMVGAAPLLAQTISFSTPPDQTLGSTPATLAASASSGLPVNLASTSPAVCSVSGSTLSLVAAGTCSINASQSGSGSYAAAAAVTRSFTVAKAAQTLSFTTPGTQTVGSNGALVASASSGLAVSFASSTSGVCTVNGTALTPVAAGTCTVTASQAGNASFAAATSVARSFTVQPAPLLAQTVSFSAPAAQTVGNNSTLTASASSGLAVVFASSTPGVCTVGGSTLTPVAAGTCSVSASQAGNGVFAAAATVTRSFTVVAAAQSLSFSSPGTQTVGTSVGLVASASSGLAVGFSVDPGAAAICAVSGSTLTLLSAGTCTVNANQAGNGAFAAALPVSQSFTSAIEHFANGGFETVGSTTPALGWLAAASGYSRSGDARSGGFSGQLASPAFNAAVLLQNSVDQGLRPALVVGQSPTLSFWAKGQAGGTGNVLFALRYLDSVGNIKANSGNRFFHTLINPNSWTRITYNLGAVPAGAVAAFIEFSQAIGPIDAGNPAGVVLIDDLSLRLP